MTPCTAKKYGKGWKVLNHNGETIAVTPQNILPSEAEALARRLADALEAAAVAESRRGAIDFWQRMDDLTRTLRALGIGGER